MSSAAGAAESAAAVWRQNTIPVIYRRGRGPLLVKLPYREDNREWLEDDRHRRAVWVAKFRCWEVPVAWFDSLVNRTLARFGKLWLIQPYRKQLKCAPACWNAKGYECSCSCMGTNHRSGHPGGKWYTVSNACAFQWGEHSLSMRMLTVSGTPPVDRESRLEHNTPAWSFPTE